MEPGSDAARIPSLPAAVRRSVERACGQPKSIEPLGGLSGSTVLRVRAEGGSAVVKATVRAAEVEFYREVAPLLAGHGILAPALYWAGQAAGRRWMVLEDVPHPLPSTRWGADADVLAVLARLHAAHDLPRLRARDAHRPAWPARATASALATLPAAESAGLLPVLDGFRAAADRIYVPGVPLSGDANPRNWGLRADGALVLFDWERFCRGMPALDLAAALPGLGTPEEHAALAHRYLVAGGASFAPRSTCEELARDVGLAKAAMAVELLAGVSEGRVADGPTAAWLRAAFPEWAREIGGAR